MAKKEYIEREALMEQVKAIHRAVNTADRNISYDTGFHCATSQIQGLIAWMPAADVVEVCRCKDCEHWGGIAYGFVCRKFSGMFTKICMGADHYCSYGERKE